jgi:hypothetical protein
MGQEHKAGRIADDFPSIAARMRELRGQSGWPAAPLECRVCDNTGWLWSAAALDRRRCPRCGISRLTPKPRGH